MPLFITKSNNSKIEDFVINLLSKNKFVVSKRAKIFMLKNEFFHLIKNILCPSWLRF